MTRAYIVDAPVKFDYKISVMTENGIMIDFRTSNYTFSVIHSTQQQNRSLILCVMCACRWQNVVRGRCFLFLQKGPKQQFGSICIEFSINSWFKKKPNRCGNLMHNANLWFAIRYNHHVCVCCCRTLLNHPVTASQTI